jgi:hypothetical protein
MNAPAMQAQIDAATVYEAFLWRAVRAGPVVSLSSTEPHTHMQPI